MEDKIEFKEEYWSNGQLWSKLQYLNGKLHGQYLNGKLHGEQLWYYPNGELEGKQQYLNGKRHGESLSYWEDGKIYSKYYYINGERVSQEEWKEFNSVEVNSPHFNLL